MKINDWLTVLAIFLGPITALFVQRSLDEIRGFKKRQRDIFRSIWATRTFPQRLAYRHVESLNMIGIDFAGISTVTDAWEEYLDKLNSPDPPTAEQAQFWRDRDEKFHALIFAMSRHLGYRFTRLEVEKQFYTPQAHGTWAEQETVLREGITRLFKNETALPIRLVGDVVEPPPPQV